MNSRFKVLPSPQGPFCTGCHDFMFGRTKQGTLMRLYYPAAQNEGKDQLLAPWFLGPEYTKGLAKFIAPLVPYMFETLFNWNTQGTRIPSSLDAPVAAGPFPLVLFSHGLAAHRALYSTFCNDLASHGFVVAALEHRDESACATFTLPEGEAGDPIWLHYKRPEQGAKEYPLRNSQVELRALECSRALDALQSLSRGEGANELASPLPPGAFRDKIDVSHPVLAGHSFGGATTLLALAQDKRFRVGVALDPWMFPLKEGTEALSERVTQPLLVVLTEQFNTDTSFKAYAPFQRHPRNTFVTLKGSVHQNQSDTPFLFGPVGRLLGGAWSTLDRGVAMRLNNKMAVNFVCKHLGMENVAPKELDVRAIMGHLLLGLELQPASFESAQELLNFQHLVNNNSSSGGGGGKGERVSSSL